MALFLSLDEHQITAFVVAAVVKNVLLKNIQPGTNSMPDTMI